jgi:hypothetical protein
VPDYSGLKSKTAAASFFSELAVPGGASEVPEV